MNYNALSQLQRSEIVNRIRLGFEPEPPPIDYSTPERLVETFVQRYYFRTDLYACEMLGITLDDWQTEVGLDVDEGVRLITVRACHNVGKSTDLAVIASKFLLTRWRCKIVMTAPSAGQLYDALFAELKSLLRNLPEAVQSAFNVKSDRIELVATPEDAFISIRTSSKDRPEALQGVHSDFVLLLPDEASGIPDEVFNAAGGSLAGENCTMLMTGNPTRLIGRFANSHLKRGYREMYKRYHISKHPYEGPDDGALHFVSKRITDAYEQEVIAEHGRNSDQYRIRVLGDFPSGDLDSYISAELVREAMERDMVAHYSAKRCWAVDPARYGNDGTALGEMHGRVVTHIERKRGLDTMQVAGWIKNKWDETPVPERPKYIFVDTIGIGSGVADRLRELGLPVRDVNVSESASTIGKHMRLRDELWSRVKLALQEKKIKLPEDDELLEDLISPRYSYSSDGRLKIESKEEMRKRGLSSPDKGDVLCMLMLESDIELHGSPGNTDWNKALNRNLQATL